MIGLLASTTSQPTRGRSRQRGASNEKRHRAPNHRGGDPSWTRRGGWQLRRRRWRLCGSRMAASPCTARRQRMPRLAPFSTGPRVCADDEHGIVRVQRREVKEALRASHAAPAPARSMISHAFGSNVNGTTSPRPSASSSRTYRRRDPLTRPTNDTESRLSPSSFRRSTALMTAS